MNWGGLRGEGNRSRQKIAKCAFIGTKFDDFYHNLVKKVEFYKNYQKIRAQKVRFLKLGQKPDFENWPEKSTFEKQPKKTTFQTGPIRQLLKFCLEI